MEADHAPWMKETMEVVSQVYDSYEVDLIIISHTNQHNLGRVIDFLASVLSCSLYWCLFLYSLWETIRIVIGNQESMYQQRQFSSI